MIEFTVPAVPIAQPRQRHRIVARGSGSAPFVANYTPTKSPVNDFKASVRQAASATYSGPPLSGAVMLAMDFVMPRPKGKIKKRGDNPRYEHTSRPDLDNLCKSVKDALSKLLWNDDSQVAELRAYKCVASADEQPHVYVRIIEL